MTHTPTLEIGVSTDAGSREQNEDSYMLPPQATEQLHQRGYLVAVADGMGGHSGGQLASQTCTRVLYEQFYGPNVVSLDAAITAVNSAVYSLARQMAAKDGMGTTLVAALFGGRRVLIAHAGDSRAYLVQHGQIEQLTHDHTLVQERVRAGLLSQHDADAFQGQNPIVRAIGNTPTVEADYTPVPQVQPGAAVVLCSDGLVKTVPDNEIAQLVTRMAPQQAAQQLVQLANQRGGPDNSTVAIVRVHALPITPQTPPTFPATGTAGNRRLVWVLVGSSIAGVLLVLAWVVFYLF